MNTIPVTQRENNPTSIVVNVRDYNDENMSSARVILIQAKDETILEYDRPSSTYYTKDIQPGTYTLRAEAEGLKTEEREVTLQAGQNRVITESGV